MSDPEENPQSDCDGDRGQTLTSSASFQLTTADITPPPIDIETVTEEAEIDQKGGNTTRGQNKNCCPTNPLLLHANTTDHPLKISGDLEIAKDSCGVAIVFGPNKPNDVKTFRPGLDIGVTFELAPGFVMHGHCVQTKGKERCEWSFTRTAVAPQEK